MGLTGYKHSVCRALLLPAGCRGACVGWLFQLLEASCMPQLITHASSIFKGSDVESDYSPVVGAPSEQSHKRVPAFVDIMSSLDPPPYNPG